MSENAEVKGVKEVEKKLVALAKTKRKEIISNLRLKAELIMTDSKQNYVPRDKGILINTGQVQLNDTEGETVSVTLSYGGPSAPYALAIHENPSPHDPPSWKGVKVNFHPAGHGAKYLSKPIQNASQDLLLWFAQRLKI